MAWSQYITRFDLKDRFKRHNFVGFWHERHRIRIFFRYSCISDFAKDAEADENDLFYVFFDDEDTEEKEIIGMFNGGKGVQHSLFGDIKNQFKTLKFSEALGLSKVSFMDNFVLVDVEDDDFYICELAICSNQRGKGYGTEALDQLIQLAKDLDCKRVVLDADFRNDGAFRLYSSKGFKIFNRKSFGVPGKKRGMRNMELILK